jgi:light-regulated signal transduction histidine kinase (bacteriophytochrome)
LILLRDITKHKKIEDANDFINYAVDGATRMQNLISDLLIFSRVGSRGKPFKTTDMNVVIENILDNFRHLIKETNS